MSPILRAEGVSFAYGQRVVLDGVSLAVRRGELVAIIGPNGAGKSTLLKLLAALLVPLSGRVLASEPRSRAVAYLAQHEDLPLDWSVREVVELGRLPHVGLLRSLTRRDDEAVLEAMRQVEVASLAERLVGTLSGGERQRVAVARALAQEPQILLLDEPARHLDLRHQGDLLSLLRAEAARGTAVVAVIHDLTAAVLADRCVLLGRRAIRADGAPRDVLRYDHLKEVFDTDVEILRASSGQLVVVPKAPMPGRRRVGAETEGATWTRSESSS